MYKKLIFIFIILPIFGCKSYYLNKYCIPEVKTKDSILTKILHRDSVSVRDSIVITPKTETSISILNPCDSLGKLRKGKYNVSQGNNKVELEITDSLLLITANCEAAISHWHNLYEATQDSLLVYRELDKSTTTYRVEKKSLLVRLQAHTRVFWWIGIVLFIAGIVIGLMKLVQIVRT